MGNMFKHTPLAAEARIVQLEKRLAIASQLSAAASALKELESSQLEPSELVMVLVDVYARLNQANEAFKALLAESETDGS